MRNYIDCHTHTRFSVDSDADIIGMIEKAMSLGLSAYAVTDHCECNRWYSEEHYPDETTYRYFDFGRDFENSVTAVTKLKEKYDGKLNLICGVEMGQGNQVPEIAEKIVSDKRLDFVIGSMHQLPKTEDFAFIEYDKMTVEEMEKLLEKYFMEVYNLSKWGKFDILGHLTYPLRYIEDKGNIKVDMSRYEEIIREIFKTIIYNGKGIEINTSGLRQKYGKPFPEYRFVKMYKELGGEIISVGSDAHTVADLGKGVADGAEIAKQAGFKYLCFFKERKPQFLIIE